MHHSLPFKVCFALNRKFESDKTPSTAGMNVTSQTRKTCTLEPPGHVREVENVNVEQEVFGTKERMHMPANYKKNWSSFKLALLANVMSRHSHLGIKSMFVEYQKACRGLGISDRSLFAFRKKMNRIK